MPRISRNCVTHSQITGNDKYSGMESLIVMVIQWCFWCDDDVCSSVVRPHTLHGGGNSRSLPSTVTVMPGDVNSPYHKQFVHSKSQQYRRLKTEWRNNVYLRRSNVQVHIICSYFISMLVHTTLWVKKTRHLTLANNFTNYWPIFRILSLLDSVGNL